MVQLQKLVHEMQIIFRCMIRTNILQIGTNIIDATSIFVVNGGLFCSKHKRQQINKDRQTNFRKTIFFKCYKQI